MTSNQYWQWLLDVVVQKDGKTEAKFRADSVRKNRFEIHVNIPFSDDPIPCESEVTIYNLSDKSIELFEVGKTVTVNAGYRGMDFGCLMYGHITSLKPTEIVGNERVTKFTIVEGHDYSKLNDVNITFNKGTDAQTIINRIALDSNLIYHEMNLKKNKIYDQGFTADGQPLQIIQEVAEACDTMVYFNRGKLLIRNYKEGQTERLKLSYDKGLISQPVLVENSDYKGWSMKYLLQHKISVGTAVSIDSRLIKGDDFFVKSGSHVLDSSGFITNIEVVK